MIQDMRGQEGQDRGSVLQNVAPKVAGASRTRYRERKREKKRRRLERNATQTPYIPTLLQTAIGGSCGVEVQSPLFTGCTHPSPRNESAWRNSDSRPSQAFGNVKAGTPKNEAYLKICRVPAITRLHGYNSPATDLTITTLRLPSPQLEHIASPTSPEHIQSAVSMLILLQSRAARLQIQIDVLQIELNITQANIHRIDQRIAFTETLSLTAKLETLEEMILLASGHWYELFVLECSLRDVIDEESGKLGNYVEEVKSDLQELVSAYDADVWEIMVKRYPQAVRATVQEIIKEGLHSRRN